MPEYRMPPVLSTCPRYGSALHRPKPFLMPVPGTEDDPDHVHVHTILPPVKENLKIRFAEEILVTEIEDRFYYNEYTPQADDDDDDDSYEIEIVEDDGDADFYLEIVDGEVFYVFETEDDISVDSSDSDGMEEVSNTAGGQHSLIGSSDDEGDAQEASYFSGDKSMSSMDLDQSMLDMNFSLDLESDTTQDDAPDDEALATNKEQQQEATPAPAPAAAATPAAAEDPPAVINIIEMEDDQDKQQQQQQQQQVETMPDATAAAETPSTNDNDLDVSAHRTTDKVVSKAPPNKPQRQPSASRSGSGLKELRASVEKLHSIQVPLEQPTLPELVTEPAPEPSKSQDSRGDDEKPCDEIGGEHSSAATTQNGEDIVSPLAPPKMGVLEQKAQQEDVHTSPSPAASAADCVSSPPLMTSPCPASPSRLASPGKSILRANPPSPRKKRVAKTCGSVGSKSSKGDKKKTKTFTKTYVRPEEFDGEHRVYAWEKPEWAKKEGEAKLRSTGKGADIRKGANLANPITFCIKGPVNPGVEEDDEKAGTKVSLVEITTSNAATNSPRTAAAKTVAGMDMEEIMRRLNAGERVAAAGVPYYRKNQRSLRISMNGAKIRDGADIVKPITKATLRTSEEAMLNKVANQKVLKTTTTGRDVREGKNLAAPVTMPLIKFDDTNHVANKNVLKNKGVAPDTKKQYDWEKPEWAQKCKLKSTNKGDAVKQGMDLQAPITQIARYRSFDSAGSGDSSRGRSSVDCYIAGPGSDDGDGGGRGRSGSGDELDRASEHERRHLLTEVKVHEWEKPDWAKNKPLTTSEKGLALKKGENLANPITFPHRRPQRAAKQQQDEEEPHQEQDGKSAS